MPAPAALTLQAAFAAAGRLTRSGVTGVANTYIAWIESKPVLALAQAALTGAAGWSKSPAAVTTKANLLYDEMVAILDVYDSPVFTSIAPTSGPAAGGTATVITGTDLNSVTSVTFGGTAGTALTHPNDETINVTTPANTVGAKQLILVGGTNGNVTVPGTPYTYV